MQRAFYNDPRVLTISLHQHPATLFPFTGLPAETGGPDAERSAVNVALPTGTGDASWLRAFHAIVPPLLHQFRPQILVSQHGCDTHRLDPLANLELSIDAQRTAGSAWNDSGGLVFTSRWGEPLYPDTVSALMTKLISAHNRSVTPPAAPLPHARLHDLRHLHATTLLLAGVPVHVVAARLGHADPAVTLRVYSHVLREHAAGVGDIFAQAVKASVSKSASQTGKDDQQRPPATGRAFGKSRDGALQRR